MSARLRRARRLGAVAALGAVCVGSTGGDIDRGDLAWAIRAEGERAGRPRAGPIGDAVAAYERALAADRKSLAARWRLLRALHFQGEFVAPDEASAARSFERGREVAEEGLDQLARRVGAGERVGAMDRSALPARVAAAGVASTDVARLHFWAAIVWAASARSIGLLAAVSEGLANRIHDYAQVTLALEPEYEDGGAYRLLGRLHAELPKVPFVSGWVDRAEALPLVERAHAMAPENPGNQLLLALTLLDLAPERRAEALALLDRVRRLTPRPSMRIEDLAMREEAQLRFAAARADETG